MGVCNRVFKMILIGCVFVNVFLTVLTIPVKKEDIIEDNIIINKRSAEFIFAGNHQNGERVKKAGPIPPMPLDSLYSPDEEIFIPPHLQGTHDEDDVVENLPGEYDQGDTQAGQLKLLEKLLLEQELEKEEEAIEDKNTELSENNDSMVDDDSKLDTDSSPIDASPIENFNSKEIKGLDSIAENIKSVEDIESPEPESYLNVNEIQKPNVEDIESPEPENYPNVNEIQKPNVEDIESPEPENYPNFNEIQKPNDYFLNIPGLRSPYQEYPPVPYPLSYAAIPVRKRSVYMNSDLKTNDVVNSDKDINTEKKSYRIKRDLHDEDDFQEEQLSYYLPKRFDDLDSPMPKDNEYYPQSPYENLEEELRLEEEALLEEAEERAARKEARKRSRQLEKFLLENELQSDRYPESFPEYPKRDNEEENYEVIVHGGKIGVFIPIENESKAANPKYSILDEEVSKREFYPIDGDRRWNNFIKSEMMKRDERNAYERIFKLAESLRKRQF